MPNNNNYITKENIAKIEEVREIPTYQPKYTDEEVARLKEIFIAEQKEAIKKYQIKGSPLSPEARSKVIRKWGSDYVSENREGYGPCSYSGCPYSTPFEIEIYIEGISRKWARGSNYGTFLAGNWEWSPTNSYLYRSDLWLTDVDQARRVKPLIVDDYVWTTNLWGEHCAEDNKFCNNALSIIRASIKHHESGYGVKVRETLDSDISKWSEWGFKVGAAVGTSFINPVAGVAIGAGSWGAGKVGQELCDSDRGKAFWGTVSGIGGDTLKGVAWGVAAQGVGAVLGAGGEMAGLSSSAASAAASRAAKEFFIVDGIKIFSGNVQKARMIAVAIRGAEVAGNVETCISLLKDAGYAYSEAKEHIEHVRSGYNYKSGCGVCNA